MAQKPKKEDASHLQKKKDKPGENKAKSQKKSSLGFTRILLILSTLTVVIAVALVSLCRTEQSCFGFGRVIKDVAHDCVKYFRGRPPAARTSSSSSDGGKKQDAEEKASDLKWMKGPIRNARILNDDEIKYVENGPLHLVLLGHVFDVSAGKDYYAPGTGYFGFIGKDGSRAFITGEFNEKGLVDELDGLSHSDYLGLANWLKFYFEKYKFVGYHAGRFFDNTGKETAYMEKTKNWIRAAELNDEAEQDLRKIFPPCNAQWSAAEGSNLWCTDQSGGVKRDWVGLPRQFFENKESPRCACVHPNYLSDPRVRPYENCDPTSTSCRPPRTD